MNDEYQLSITVDLLLILNIRSAVGMKRWHCLHSPSLTLGAFRVGPVDHWLVRIQNQPCPGVGELDAVAARLPNVVEEGLVDRMVLGTISGVAALFEKVVCSFESVFACVRGEGQMVEAAALTGPVIGVYDVVGFLRESEPSCCVAAFIKFDLLGFPRLHDVVPEIARGMYICRQVVNVVETSGIDSAAWETGGLVF